MRKCTEYIKNNIKEKKKNNNKNYRCQWIIVVGEEKKVKTWQMVRKIHWCERNNKNKLHMYFLTCGIKLVYILSFTFESNRGTNLKAILECMNRQ